MSAGLAWLCREVVVAVGCAHAGVFRLCLERCLGVPATKNPGTCVGPSPCRYSVNP